MNDDKNEYTLVPTTLTYGGEALGRLPDGRAVFIPFALPGETVRVKILEEKKRFARAELVEVIQPSPDRIEPFCSHFGVCGGCHYQHLAYDTQLEVKGEILRDQLQRIGGFTNPPVKNAVPSARPIHYRNHVQFDLTPEGRLGFHVGRSDQVFALQECYLPEDPIDILWRQLDLTEAQGVDQIGIRVGDSEDLQVILKGSQEDVPQFSVEDAHLSAVHLTPGGSLVLAGSEYVVMKVMERHFRVSAGAFFQVNTHSAALMVDHVLAETTEYLSLTPDTTLIDAYCGVGLFSAFLAPLVGRLIGIESSPAACADFEINLDEFDHVELYEATAEEVLPHLDLQPNVLVIDPPRGGIDRHALDSIVKMRATVLVYISCDPSTLSRDGKRLSNGGYQLMQVTPFDLFPQTYHIESISFWMQAL